MAMMSTSIVRVSSRKEVAGEGEEAAESLDWYAWLSRTRLDPARVYEYALVFTRNELEEEDVVHFDHEFLLSMGVSVAKHRLEILELAKEERRRRRPRLLGRPRPVARLLAAADRTRRCLARCLRSLSAGVGGGGGGGAGSTALVPVRRWNPIVLGCGGQWGGRKLASLKQGRLLLTDGKARTAGRTWYRRWGSRKDKVRDSGGEAGEVRWDSMFRDLKPT